jgi:hypothetical protein
MTHAIKDANQRPGGHRNHGTGPCGQNCNPDLELCEYKVTFYRWAIDYGPETTLSNVKLREELWRWWSDQLERAKLRELPRHQRGFVNDQVQQSR